MDRLSRICAAVITGVFATAAMGSGAAARAMRVPAERAPSMVSIAVLDYSRDFQHLYRAIDINGFSMERTRKDDYREDATQGATPVDPKPSGKTVSYAFIHPYFLRNGKNDFVVSYALSKFYGEGPFRFAFNITEAAWVVESRGGIKFGRLLAAVKTPAFASVKDDGQTPPTLKGEFQYEGKLPEWSWIKGIKIASTDDNKRTLYAAYRKIWDGLKSLAAVDKSSSETEKRKFEDALRADTKEFIAASTLGDKADGIDRLIRIAKSLGELPRAVPGSLSLGELPPLEEVTMTVFAGGSLAKLNNQYATMIRYGGGAHDAAPGKMGPVDIGYDVWFRKNAQGDWVPDAVCPAGEDPF